MKNLLSLIILTVTISTSVAQGVETIKVYHGNKGSTGILSLEGGRLTVKRKIQLIRAVGTKFSLEVINAHEALYKYNTSSDTFNIDYGLPDFGELVSFFDKLLPSSTKKPSLDSNELLEQLKSLGYLTKEVTELESVFLLDKDKEEQLKRKLQELKLELKAFNELIQSTDKPESMDEAFQYSSDSRYGLRSNIDSIHLSDLLAKLVERKESITALIKDVYRIGSLDEDIRVTYLNSIIGQLEKIRVDYSKLKSPYVFKKEIVVDYKPKKIYLSISSLSKSDKTRDVGEKLIEIEVIPYKVNRVEIVPVISMNYTDNLSSFEVRNGVISESEEDGFSFKPGLLIAVNAFYFGKYKEFSFGPSLGYSLDSEQQFLQNFNVGLLFSFQQKIRIGFGWGMQKYRSALADKSLLGAALPQDQTIDDVTKRVGRSTFSINFSLVGLSIFNK